MSMSSVFRRKKLLGLPHHLDEEAALRRIEAFLRKEEAPLMVLHMVEHALDHVSDLADEKERSIATAQGFEEYDTAELADDRQWLRRYNEQFRFLHALYSHLSEKRMRGEIEGIVRSVIAGDPKPPKGTS